MVMLIMEGKICNLKLYFLSCFNERSHEVWEKRASWTLECTGLLVYKLALPPALARVHNVFHVPMVRKYILNPSHPIFWTMSYSGLKTTSCMRKFELESYTIRIICYVSRIYSLHPKLLFLYFILECPKLKCSF